MKNYYSELKILLEKSYSPYSNFPVAAIIVFNDNQIYKGVNVENAAYPSGLCAERSALFGAVANTNLKVGEVKEVHVISKNNEPVSPCLGCRQVMTEFMKPDSKIYLYSYDGKIVNEYSLKELAPHPVVMNDIAWAKK
ncbi:cytidine deaminase [Mycoplasmopsis agassizii]|uniref:cytidine deaminase n=1 Tax=Mycoplasmopsis agassizii TaxID=33922 RepID=UPI0035293049